MEDEAMEGENKVRGKRGGAASRRNRVGPTLQECTAALGPLLIWPHRSAATQARSRHVVRQEHDGMRSQCCD
ncbi:hypothetical protein E2562_031679 [Oryza meyeriana var. granulata]|uniref:Uncharacterized protein n=1 Tax=Oryza meyeriana var. granulata TaxID=110450 RepID=A0A6G1E4X0_9ORYZ|nr:hypothetical protein E2562_031679 [Oryza meyeriana var. granulata]